MKYLLITLMSLATSPTILMAQNSAPVINKLFVTERVQGEQGVIQSIVKGVAEDAEDEMKLKYEYRILSGNATLEPIKRYAILHKNDESAIVIELKATDSKGASTTKTINVSKFKIEPEKLYTDKTTWTAAIGKNYKKHPSFMFQERDEKLPNVLIIGNSISIGYTSYVQNELKGKCNVYRIPENGGDTKRCLDKLDLWLGDNNWDVIHFNFGLHDLKRLKNNKLDITGDVVNTKKEYADNLNKIVKRLKTETNAKLIWATTSVVPDGAEGRKKGLEVKYNRVAKKIMKNNQIKIDDQYTLSHKHPEEQREANVHFLEEGKERQAKQVAQYILECLY